MLDRLNIDVKEEEGQCDRCWRNVCTNRTININEASDGLINVSSQIGQSSAEITSDWRPQRTFEVVGANHGEQREHPGVKESLRSIFNRDGNLAADFRVAPR